MRVDDAGPCGTVFARSLNALAASYSLPMVDARGRDRVVLHLLGTDPEGSCVAVDSAGEIVGYVQAARREDVWVLTQLFVLPEAQEAHVGKRLLAEALKYGSDAAAGIIAASSDPRAIPLYARLSGFAVIPMLTARGVVDRTRLTEARGVRGGSSSDLGLAAEIDRAIRRGARDPDVRHLLDEGATLLVVDDRGYAVAGPAGPHLLAARDEEAAVDLLRASLALCADGAEITMPRFGAAQPWALAVALEMRLQIRPAGPLFVRQNAAATSAYLAHNKFC